MDDLLVLVKGKSASDPQLRAVRKKVRKGTADFNDTAQYSETLSKLIGKNLSANILDIPPDVREKLSTELLEYGYTDINELLNDVQISLDEKNGIHIRSQRADFPTERVEQFVHSLIDPTVDDNTIKRRAKAGSETITKSFHDDYMKKNAAFRSDAGLKCYIVRTAAYKCCEWCSNIAGRYPYNVDEMPEDVFRRHDNCDCRTILENGRERQDVWTKRTWEVPETGPGAESPAVFTEEQAKAIEQRNLQQFRGVKINNSSIDNSGGSGIITGRGSGKNSALSDNHSYEKIGEIDFKDKKAVARSLAEFESKYQSSDIEHCRVICPDGNVYEVHGDRCRVNTGLLGDKMNGSINDHNHVTGESQYSFSWEDISSSAEDGSHIVMAYDEKYRYSMTFPDKAIDANVLREAYDVSENEVDLNNFNYQYYSIGSRISDEDHQHEIIKRTCERVGVKYERKLKT